MNSKIGAILGIIAIIIAATALTVAVVDISRDTTNSHNFTLYIGLDDKDQGERVLPITEIIPRIDTICSRYLSGYTLIPAFGRWNNEDNTLIKENTVICNIIDSNEDTVKKIANEICVALNQSSILVVDGHANYSYYSSTAE